jgi:hypothetical protein
VARAGLPGALSEHPVELWFVRHGESKNNAILKAAGGLGAILYPVKFDQDPHITKEGVRVAKSNGQRLLAANAKFDMVLSSAMVRTMETAYYMFVETNIIDRVYVAPFISEVPLAFMRFPLHENIPLSREEQVSILGLYHGSELLDRLDFSVVGGPLGDNEETLPPNGDNFLRWLDQQDVLWNLIESRKAAGQGSGEAAEPIRIGVVTHSHFMMKKNLLRLDKRPRNADIWIAKAYAMRTGAEPLLTLTNVHGWYQEAVESEREKMGALLHKAEEKSRRLQRRYAMKIASLQKKLAEREERYRRRGKDVDPEDRQKAADREVRYNEQMAKDQTKLESEIGRLQQEVSSLQQPADSPAADPPTPP